MKKLLLIVLLFPWLATAKEHPPTLRICRILLLTSAAEAPKKLFLCDGVASHAVDLSEMELSPIYKVAAGDAVVSLTRNPVADPGQVPPGAPSAQLPASIGDFYLVVSDDPANTVAPVRLQVLDAGPQQFRKGQMMWFNLTSSAISGQLGGQKMELAAQARALVDDPAKTSEPYDVKLSYLIPNDPVAHPIIQTKWVHDPRSRLLVLVCGGERNTAPHIAGFKDLRDAPEKAK